MGKNLVLIGGGHAHMITLENLNKFIEKGHRVTVIGPSEYHYYSGMGPGMLGMTYTPDDIRFETKKEVEKKGGTFIKDSVSHINPDKKKIYTITGNNYTYDVLSFNAGSYVPLEMLSSPQENVYTVKPIEGLIAAGEKIKALLVKKQPVISIVGGGPSSAEISGNIFQLAKNVNAHMPIIKIFAGKKFMAGEQKSVRIKIASILSKKGIEIIESGYVNEISENRITLESGETIESDVVFLALGVKPSKIFQDSGLPVGPDKGLRVNKYLQSVKYPEIFGGGDCIYFEEKPLDKVGVYAVRENPVLFNNLMASLEGGTLEVFTPQPDYLVIFNLGGGEGLLKKKWLTFSGKFAFIIKDYIDRKFMKRFQIF